MVGACREWAVELMRFPVNHSNNVLSPKDRLTREVAEGLRRSLRRR